MATASIKVLRRQAERCAALATQTQDEVSRERYLRLQQMYLQFLELEEAAASTSPGDGVSPAA